MLWLSIGNTSIRNPAASSCAIKSLWAQFRVKGEALFLLINTKHWTLTLKRKWLRINFFIHYHNVLIIGSLCVKKNILYKKESSNRQLLHPTPRLPQIIVTLILHLPIASVLFSNVPPFSALGYTEIGRSLLVMRNSLFSVHFSSLYW